MSSTALHAVERYVSLCFESYLMSQLFSQAYEPPPDNPLKSPIGGSHNPKQNAVFQIHVP